MNPPQALHFVEAIPPSVRVTAAASFYARQPRGTLLYHGTLTDPRVAALGNRAVAIARDQVGKPCTSMKVLVRNERSDWTPSTGITPTVQYTSTVHL